MKEGKSPLPILFSFFILTVGLNSTIVLKIRNIDSACIQIYLYSKTEVIIMSSEYAVELEGITKIFPGGVQANKNITLKVRRGEVIGLLGENGAGKSTLMNILYGLLQPDEGRIAINGEEIDLKSPQDAILRGVGMVHQHFKLVPVLTVTENPLRMPYFVVLEWSINTSSLYLFLQ
jgi:ABC-type multidrug transport system fused ATPase/permease subunit